MAIMLLDQIRSAYLRLEKTWGTDLQPSRTDATAELAELEDAPRFLGSDGEPVLADIVALRRRIDDEQ